MFYCSIALFSLFRIAKKIDVNPFQFKLFFHKFSSCYVGRLFFPSEFYVYWLRCIELYLLYLVMDFDWNLLVGSRVCGNPHGIIRKYGLMCCRQCFRSNAKEIGFIKVRVQKHLLTSLVSILRLFVGLYSCVVVLSSFWNALFF